MYRRSCSKSSCAHVSVYLSNTFFRNKICAMSLDKQNQLSDLKSQKSFLINLRKQKTEDIELQRRQVDLITQDIKTIDDKLLKEETVLGSDLSVTSRPLPLTDNLPGPSGVQSTPSKPHYNQMIEWHKPLTEFRVHQLAEWPNDSSKQGLSMIGKQLTLIHIKILLYCY